MLDAAPALDETLPQNKACNLEDFADPELRPLIQRIFSYEVERFGDAFPYGREDRKQWETAMAVRSLEQLGALGPDAALLGVGAGGEPASFWLTRFARRVFATPGDRDSGWPGDWDRGRRVIQQTDPLQLDHESDSLDGVFSSSLERFGAHAEVRRAAEEMCRVLKPGGVATISTELRIEGPSPGKPGCLMFDADEVGGLIEDGLPWLAASPLDTSLSAATLATEQSRDELVEDGRYPAIALRWGEHLFTRVHLALVKHA